MSWGAVAGAVGAVVVGSMNNKAADKRAQAAADKPTRTTSIDDIIRNLTSATSDVSSTAETQQIIDALQNDEQFQEAFTKELQTNENLQQQINNEIAKQQQEQVTSTADTTLDQQQTTVGQQTTEQQQQQEQISSGQTTTEQAQQQAATTAEEIQRQTTSGTVASQAALEGLLTDTGGGQAAVDAMVDKILREGKTSISNVGSRSGSFGSTTEQLLTNDLIAKAAAAGVGVQQQQDAQTLAAVQAAQAGATTETGTTTGQQDTVSSIVGSEQTAAENLSNLISSEQLASEQQADTTSTESTASEQLSDLISTETGTETTDATTTGTQAETGQTTGESSQTQIRDTDTATTSDTERESTTTSTDEQRQTGDVFVNPGDFVFPTGALAGLVNEGLPQIIGDVLPPQTGDPINNGLPPGADGVPGGGRIRNAPGGGAGIQAIAPPREDFLGGGGGLQQARPVDLTGTTPTSSVTVSPEGIANTGRPPVTAGIRPAPDLNAGGPPPSIAPVAPVTQTIGGTPVNIDDDENLLTRL